MAALISHTSAQDFILGADLSYVNTITKNGGVYRTEQGQVVDPFEIFDAEGVNMVRLRLWHDPSQIIDHCGQEIEASNLNDMLESAKRAIEKGMKIKLAIHYSDYFADPGKQRIPKAWENASSTDLLDSIYNYTYNVLRSLDAQMTRPSIVAIGNETVSGFIDNTDHTNGFEWTKDADKFNVAFKAVDDFNTDYGGNIKKAIHLTASAAAWGTQTFLNHDVTNFDIIGFSYYPKWEPDLDIGDIGNLVQRLKTDFDKSVVLFETGFAWTTDFADNYGNFINENGSVTYPISPLGQRAFLIDLRDELRRSGADGMMYWEPGWISSDMCDQWGQGSSYENVSLFDFNNGNRALPGFDVFDLNVSSSGYLKDDLSIKIYPNPASEEKVYIEAQGEVDSYILLDQFGSQLREVKVKHKENKKTIEVNDLTQGIYFIKICMDTRSVVERLVIM